MSTRNKTSHPAPDQTPARSSETVASVDAAPELEPLAQTEGKPAPGSSVEKVESVSAEEIEAAARQQIVERIGAAKVAALEERGFDTLLLTELAQLSPEMAEMLRRVVRHLKAPRPAPLYQASHHPTERDLVESILGNAICAAHAALQLKRGL